MARQVEADVVMNLNEQGQEQLGVDAPHSAQAAVDGQELTQAAGCLGAEGRCVGSPDPLSQHPGRAGTASLGGQTWIFALLKAQVPLHSHALEQLQNLPL